MKRLFIILVLLTTPVFAGLDAKGGKVINVATPTDLTDATNKNYVDAHIVATGTPASASATGIVGTIVWDSGYIYVCVATDTWERVAISTWVIPTENVIFAGENVIFAAEQVVYP